MTLLFSESGISENAEVSNPTLQGIFIPAIDKPTNSDGFGISVPWGGGDSARNYSSYGPIENNTAEATQLNDLADNISYGGSISFDTEGLIGPQGVQGPTGPQGPQGIPGIAFFPTNFITDLSTTLDSINTLWGSGGDADTLLYSSSVLKKWNITWSPFDIDSGVSTWNDVAIDLDGSFISIASNGGIYISTDFGSNWNEKIPEADNFSSISCNSLGSKIITIGDSGKAEGNIWTSDDYGENWSEVTVTGDDTPTGDDLCVGTTDGNTLNDSDYETRSITFSSPGALTSGKKYAIVVRAPDGDIATDMIDVAGSNSYPNGELQSNAVSGEDGWWFPETPARDFWFQTFEGVAYRDQYAPGTTPNGFLIADNYWFAQVFTASSSYDISKVNLKMKRYPGGAPGTVTVSIKEINPSGEVNDSFVGAGGLFVAVATTVGVALSTDFGSNWTNYAPDGSVSNWERIICSTDGTYVYTWDDSNNIYRTANGGTSWALITPAGGDSFSPNDIAISSTGQFVIIVGSNSTDTSESAYLSTNYGVTWTAVNPTSNVVIWDECSIDNSGNTMTVVDTSLGYFYASFDGGTTWTSQNIPASSSSRSSIAISGDGSLGIVCNESDNNEVFRNTGYYSELVITDTPFTSAGRALVDDTTSADQVATLGFTETAGDISDHVFSSGDDHTWLDQDLTIAASPVHAGLTISGAGARSIDIYSTDNTSAAVNLFRSSDVSADYQLINNAGNFQLNQGYDGTFSSTILHFTGGGVTAGCMGLNTITPAKNLAGGTYDLSGIFFHNYSATATSGFIAEGNLGATLDLIDLGGGENDKWLRLTVDGGLAVMSSYNDDGSVLKSGVLSVDLGTGVLSSGFGFSGLDLTNITDGTVPYISASGFADSLLKYISATQMAFSSYFHKFGLGTTNPAYQLDIYNNSTTTRPLIRLQQEGAGDIAMGFRRVGVVDYIFGYDNTDGRIKFDHDADLGDDTIWSFNRTSFSFFDYSAEGDTNELTIYGHRTGDSKHTLEIGVGVDAADTASFDGVSNYLFDGNINCNNSLSLKEKADDNADIAAYGQVWVKTETPNTLWFTNDVGTKVQLGLRTYGEIYAYESATEITISATGIDNKVQITAFAANGTSNNTTPDHTTDDITILRAGTYLITVSLSLESAAAGTGCNIGVGVYKNNGATQFQNLHTNRKLSGGGTDYGSVSMSGIVNLSVNDTVEVWVWNYDNTDNVIIDDITLSVLQIGE